MSIQRSCQVCMQSFFVEPRQIRRGWGNFCSRSCSNTGRTKPLELSFWAFVERSDPYACWTWTGSIIKDGYGQLFFKGRTQLAHRVSYLIHRGSFVSRLYVCHHCDNPSCVNPLHLFLGTQKENMQDMREKGRAWKP